jgi:hypothetical protein
VKNTPVVGMVVDGARSVPVVVAESKRCNSCCLWFGLDDFHRDRHQRDGRMRRCKGCESLRTRAFYAANRDERLAASNVRALARAGQRFCRLCDLVTCSPKSPYCVKHREEALARRVQRRYRRNMTPEQLMRAKERERRRRRAERPMNRLFYGTSHKKLRAELAKTVALGSTRCASCGETIHAGEPWDLGHVPGGGPSDYRGPEHARCNRATAKRAA